LADAETLGLFQHGVAEGDVGKRQTAMPEQIRFVVALAAGLKSGNDLPELIV
jgi:hypothetical protein